MSQQRLRTIDGIRSVPPQIERSAQQSAALTTPQPRPFQITPASAASRSIWQRVQLPLLLCGGMVMGFLVQSLLFGLVAIALYGIISVIYRIPSRITFMLAFMSLVTVAVLLVVRPGAALAGTFATYTFLLLVVGVIALAIEARPLKRRKRPKRRTRG